MRLVAVTLTFALAAQAFADQPCFEILVDRVARAASDDGSVLAGYDDPNLWFWTEERGLAFRDFPPNVNPGAAFKLLVSEDGSTILFDGHRRYLYRGNPLVLEEPDLQPFSFSECGSSCSVFAMSADGDHIAGSGVAGSGGLADDFGCGWYDRRPIVYTSPPQNDQPATLKAISDNGRVVAGSTFDLSQGIRATYWDRDVENTIGPGAATACTDDLVIAGTTLSDGAWRWEQGLRETIGPSGDKADISDDGLTITISDVTGGSDYMWEPVRGARTLPELLADRLIQINQGFWTSYRMLGVSDDGQTVIGTVSQTGSIGDFTFRLRLGTTCAGDLDENGSVGLEDLAVLLAEFGGPGVADFNCDGEIGIFDLATMLKNFGEACP